MASISNGKFTFIGWTDNDFWRAVGLTGVEYFFWQLFSNGSIRVSCLYIPLQWVILKTLDTRQHSYTHSFVESHLELHIPLIWSFNHPRSKAKDLSTEKLVCIRSWWSVLTQVKALACYSWWLASPRRSWWLRCFLRSLPSWLWEPEEDCTWLDLHHAGMVNGDS